MEEWYIVNTEYKTELNLHSEILRNMHNIWFNKDIFAKISMLVVIIFFGVVIMVSEQTLKKPFFMCYFVLLILFFIYSGVLFSFLCWGCCHTKIPMLIFKKINLVNSQIFSNVNRILFYIPYFACNPGNSSEFLSLSTLSEFSFFLSFWFAHFS